MYFIDDDVLFCGKITISAHRRQRKRPFFDDDDHGIKIVVDVLIHYGDRVSLDGVAARGLVSGRGPSLAMGGMKSELVPTNQAKLTLSP